MIDKNKEYNIPGIPRIKQNIYINIPPWYIYLNIYIYINIPNRYIYINILSILGMCGMLYYLFFFQSLTEYIYSIYHHFPYTVHVQYSGLHCT